MGGQGPRANPLLSSSCTGATDPSSGTPSPPLSSETPNPVGQDTSPSLTSPNFPAPPWALVWGDDSTVMLVATTALLGRREWGWGSPAQGENNGLPVSLLVPSSQQQSQGPRFLIPTLPCHHSLNYMASAVMLQGKRHKSNWWLRVRSRAVCVCEKPTPLPTLTRPASRRPAF